VKEARTTTSGRSRAALAAAAAVGASAFAGSALAANTGTISVSQAGSATTIRVSIPKETDPIARVTIFVPSGYGVTLGQAPGTAIGAIPQAEAFSYDDNLTLPLSGTVVVADPADATVAAEAQACVGTTAPAAAWNLNLALSGLSLAVPMFVTPTAGAAQALGSYALTACLPPPDVPQGTPGRAALGAQLLDAQFTVGGVFAPPAGQVVWEALMTPYNPGAGTADLAGTFETRAVVATATASLKAKIDRKTHVVTLTGTVAAGGAPLAGSVTVFRGSSPKKLSAAGTANAKGGRWTLRLKAKGKKPVYFRVSVRPIELDLTVDACRPPQPTVAPAGCVHAGLAPGPATSNVVKVKP
jgi:hypothetical protein